MGLSGVMRGWAILELLVLVGACGGRAALDGEPGAPATVMPSANDLNPPPNIDARVCEAALPDAGAASATVQSACSDCCARTEFPLSVVYEQQCLCGRLLDRSGPLACPGTFLTQERCASCCTRAGFAFSIGPSGDVASCSCALKSNQQVCAATAQAAAPDQACQRCCLNQGYLSAEYTTAGAPQCQCLDGTY